MSEEYVNKDDDNLNNSDNKKEGFKTKLNNFFDNLILLLSVWVSILLLIYLNQYLPETNWPFFLDKFLALLLLFILVYFTLSIMQGVIKFALIILIPFGAIFLILSFSNQKGKEANSNYKALTCYVTPNNVINDYLNTIDSICNDNRKLQQEIDSIKHIQIEQNNKLDSILFILNE
jgi:Ca2+/Na+ antiporter